MSTMPPPSPEWATPDPDPPRRPWYRRPLVVIGAGVAAMIGVGLLIPDDLGDDDEGGGPIGGAIGEALDDAADTGAAVAADATTTDPPETTTTTTEAPPTTTTTEVDLPDDIDEWIAVAAVRLALEQSGDPVLAGGIATISDDEIIEVGESVCSVASFQADGDAFGFVEVVQQINAGTGLSDNSAAMYVGALLGAFCPDELSRLGIE